MIVLDASALIELLLRTPRAAHATQAVNELHALTIVRYPNDPLLARTWSLRGNLTAYDAPYVALAEHLGAPLVTCDAQLASAPGLPVTIELIA